MEFARKLRKGKVRAKRVKPTKTSLILALDNIYDTFNVGGMYRIGDAAGVDKIVHGGETPCPPNPKISRASVGLDKYISHEYQKELVSYLVQMKQVGYVIIILEQAKAAKLFDRVDYAQYAKIILVAGNETFGVQKPVLALADLIIELPMYGVNKSLNVVVSTGIALYQIQHSMMNNYQ